MLLSRCTIAPFQSLRVRPLPECPLIWFFLFLLHTQHLSSAEAFILARRVRMALHLQHRINTCIEPNWPVFLIVCLKHIVCWLKYASFTIVSGAENGSFGMTLLLRIEFLQLLTIVCSFVKTGPDTK
jgi:hypothetical protein